MAEIMTRGDFAKFLKNTLKRVVDKEAKQYTPQYPSLFDKETTGDAFEEYIDVPGLSLVPVINEGEDMTYTKTRQGLLWRLTPVKYGKGVICTEEMIDDCRFQNLPKWAKLLTRAYDKTRETVGHNVYNRAFSTSYTTADGKALCATDHPRFGDGGTYSNRLATDVDLSEAALEDMVYLIRNMRAEDGTIASYQPRSVHIHFKEEFNAQRILNPAAVERPGTGNRDINVIAVTRMFPGGLHVHAYFDDEDAWFVRTDVEDAMIYLERQAPKFDRNNEFRSKSLYFDIRGRYAFGTINPRAVAGTPGK